MGGTYPFGENIQPAYTGCCSQTTAVTQASIKTYIRIYIQRKSYCVSDSEYLTILQEFFKARRRSSHFLCILGQEEKGIGYTACHILEAAKKLITTLEKNEKKKTKVQINQRKL